MCGADRSCRLGPSERGLFAERLYQYRRERLMQEEERRAGDHPVRQHDMGGLHGRIEVIVSNSLPPVARKHRHG